MFFKLCTLLYLFTFITNGHSQGCFYDFSDFPDKEPVLLNNNYTLIEPKGTGISLNIDEEILLACPGNSGSKNYFVNFPANLILAKCAQNIFLKVNGLFYPFSMFNCSKAITGDVLVSNDSIAGNIIKNIGYNITNTWATLFSVLYNDSRGETIYSKHTLYGSAILNAKKDSNRPSFKSAGLGPGVTADNGYKQATQKTTFASLLNSSELADKYINTTSYLARGHLSPDGDFVYISSQYTTYFYINTVPQWQTINNGNWKSMEGSIRNTAAAMNQDLVIITGGFQVLTLPDINGNDQEIYLVSSKKLPVPKYVWKVVYSPNSKQAIGFVCHNNPFSGTNNDYLCRNVCQENKWGTTSWSNSSKGLLYCCEYGELKSIVPSVPDLDVIGILTGQNN